MNLTKKRTEMIERNELKAVLKVAVGAQEPDLLIKDVNCIDIINGGEQITNIAFCGKFIAGIGSDYNSGSKVIEGKGLTIVPGFIDSHLHIESSMMHPLEFERLTLPLGTTTAICDPHEITNVLGEDGVSWFLRCAEKMYQNLMVQIPSCIPALPGFETNGADFTLDQMKKFKDHSNVMGLAEMMNFPGVTMGDDGVLDKLDEFRDGTLDGHTPMVIGKTLNAYLAAGIQNCHETIGQEEALEKLRKGMAIMMREGSVAKNLNTLAPIVNEFNSSQCLLCTDDRNPYEILHEGHINHLVKMLIKDHKMPPHMAFRIASFSAAKHFGLKRVGLIAPGYRADFVLLKDVNNVEIEEVYIGGKAVSSLNLSDNRYKETAPPEFNSMKREKVSAKELTLDLQDASYNVIEAQEFSLITNHLKVACKDGQFADEDILSLSVVERHGNNNPSSNGLVKGIGIKNGALASSVAHDSHNIIVVGDNADDMALAVNTLIERGGGFCVVSKGKLVEILELPIAGLLAKISAEEISEKIVSLKKAYKELGGELQEPFLQLAFLALPVIPHLKLTDKGLFDVNQFKFIPLVN